MTSVFISYRREDTTAGWASRIHDRLTEGLGLEAFMDVDSLPAGVNWQARIDQVLHECDVALVLIGRLWLTVTDKAGRPRLDNPADVHRLEIAEALRQDWVRVVPVLIGPTVMPDADVLPENIRGLLQRQVCVWHEDESTPSQLRRIEDAVRLGPLRPRPPSDHARASGSAAPRPESGAATASSPASGAPANEPSAGEAISAHVLGLLAELVHETSDPGARHALEQIQQSLQPSRHGGRRVLADAAQADAALNRLEALSYTDPGLSFFRDRVEELRDSGPDMQIIELAKWFDRCPGDVDLPAARVSEMARLLTGATTPERLELRPDATEAEISAAARGRIADWRTFDLDPGASPNARRAAAEVVRYYEQMLASSGGIVRA